MLRFIELLQARPEGLQGFSRLQFQIMSGECAGQYILRTFPSHSLRCGRALSIWIMKFWPNLLYEGFDCILNKKRSINIEQCQESAQYNLIQFKVNDIRHIPPNRQHCLPWSNVSYQCWFRKFSKSHFYRTESISYH